MASDSIVRFRRRPSKRNCNHSSNFLGLHQVSRPPRDRLKWDSSHVPKGTGQITQMLKGVPQRDLRHIFRHEFAIKTVILASYRMAC